MLILVHTHGANSIFIMKFIIKRLKVDLLRIDNSYHAVASGRSFYEQCLPSSSLSIGYRVSRVIYHLTVLLLLIKMRLNRKHSESRRNLI